MREDKEVLLITGSRKGIGRYLAEYYLAEGYIVAGCSREKSTLSADSYEHFCLDVTDELAVKKMVTTIYKKYNRIDVLINNAGIASMDSIFLTPLTTARKIMETNFIGTFLCSREVAKVMMRRKYGRVVNIVSIATPLKLEWEGIYAPSKAAVLNFTQIFAKEMGIYGITCNAIGPTAIDTDLIRSVPEDKLDRVIEMQTIRRIGEFRDVSNVIDFFIRKESDFITGQVIYLGGV
jgi:3-oxoacyl-[acyl-carrier protein] reductase